MTKVYRKRVILEVEIQALNNAEAEEILHQMFLVDDKELEVKVEQCDVEDI